MRLDARLDALMGVVKLSGLIQREGGWGAVASWGDTMSLGARPPPPLPSPATSSPNVKTPELLI